MPGVRGQGLDLRTGDTPSGDRRRQVRDPAEILVTTNGGPGYATTNITFMVYAQSLLQFDVGGGAAGGIVAVVLANIVAIVLMRMIGKNLEA